MQEGDPLKQVGFFIESAKICKILSSGVILKSPNNVTFSYVPRYMEKFSDKPSKNIDLLWSGCLYAPTIIHFLKRRFISRRRTSLSSFSEFSCFTGMISLTYLHRAPPKLFLSCLNILSILVSDTKNISDVL